MLARSLLAAVLALLISGDITRLGWDAVEPWHFIFPYLWLFILLESGRARRRMSDGAVFFAGASMAMFYGGVYAKDLQHGFHPFGIDWLGSLCAVFDGGMSTVLALHVAERLRPRREGESGDLRMLTIIFLVFTLAAAAAVYGIKTAFNFYRADRMLGPTWLVADILFAWAAWTLARRAWIRSESEEEEEKGREPWVWALAGFAVWLPGARFFALACAALELPGVLIYFFVGVWTAGAATVIWRLWRERAHNDLFPVSGSRPASAAALWRAAGALLLVLALGADLNEPRAAGLFSAAIDWPTRALFAWAFLTSRLKL